MTTSRAIRNFSFVIGALVLWILGVSALGVAFGAAGAFVGVFAIAIGMGIIFVIGNWVYERRRHHGTVTGARN